MILYEVVRWGNASDDIFTGGPNGPDTCFLVRAASLEEAAQLVDTELAKQPSKLVDNWAGAAHLWGTDASSSEGPKILRGPYIQHAYNHGWRCWHRNEASGPWVERQDVEAKCAS